MPADITEPNIPSEPIAEEGIQPLPNPMPEPVPPSPAPPPPTELPTPTPAAADLETAPPSPSSPPTAIPETIISPPPIAAPTPIPASSDQNIISRLLSNARAKIQARKQTRLAKIMTALNEKPSSNKELCALIKKSRFTVNRLMNELEKQNKVRQIGKTGRNTRYELIR